MHAPHRTRRLELAAWAGFAISGVLYLVSGVRSGDWLVIWGSLVWLVAVGLFLRAWTH